jgi:hypothetical protein
MRLVISAIALLMFSGCSTLQYYAGPGWAERRDSNPDDKYVMAETTWHALNVLDTAQTLHVAAAPECYHEADPLTRTIIGKHPGKGEVAAIGAAYSLAVHYIGKWLKRKADDGGPDSGWNEARAGFHILAIGSKLVTVSRNHAIGLRPFGSGC